MKYTSAIQITFPKNTTPMISMQINEIKLFLTLEFHLTYNSCIIVYTIAMVSRLQHKQKSTVAL